MTGLTLIMTFITVTFSRKKWGERVYTKPPKKPRKMPMQTIPLSRKVDLLKALSVWMNMVTPFLVTPTTPPSSLVFAVGQGKHQAYDGTDHTDSSNDGHYNHRRQQVANHNGFGAISRRVPICVERRKHQEGGLRSKHSINTKWQ